MIVRQIGLLVAFSAVISMGLSQPARTQTAKITQGKTLARSLCSNCHIVGPGEAPAVVNVDIPSFVAVAAKDGQSAEKIKANVLNPHPVMPQVQLSKPELDAIAAYIMSLKEKP